MAASDREDAAEWLVLVYRLPSKPASLRLTVRRKLTGTAVYLSPACAAAPLSGPAERAMRQARTAITRAGGFAVLLAARALAGEFRYLHLWEKDIALRQLSARYRAISGRDLFGACQAQAAASALADYHSAVNEYAAHVYAADRRS